MNIYNNTIYLERSRDCQLRLVFVNLTQRSLYFCANFISHVVLRWHFSARVWCILSTDEYSSAREQGSAVTLITTSCDLILIVLYPKVRNFINTFHLIYFFIFEYMICDLWFIESWMQYQFLNALGKEYTAWHRGLVRHGSHSTLTYISLT